MSLAVDDSEMRRLRRHRLMLGAAVLLVVALLLPTLIWYYGRARRAESRTQHLLRRDNDQCNVVHGMLKNAMDEKRAGRLDYVPPTMGAIELLLFPCATSAKEVRDAGHDVEKLLLAIPQRAIDDPSLADRDDWDEEGARSK